jgi:glycine cleavage system aminomethyltransferase T
LGGQIDIRGDGGEILKARIVATPFYDPKNARQRPVVAA